MRYLVLFAVSILVLASPAAALAAGSGVAVPGDRAAPEPTSALASPSSGAQYAALQGLSTPPETEISIDLRPDRGADWQITVRYRFESQNDTEAFRAVAEDFEAGEAESGLNVGLFERFAGLASEATDRPMSIENVQRSSSTEENVGELRLSFTWTGFLEQQERNLVLNDVFQTPSGDTWLFSLGDSQTLQIRTPSEYAITGANHPFQDNTITIEGPHTFDAGDPVDVTYVPTTETQDVPWGALGAVAFAAAAVLTGAFFLRQREADEAPSDPAPASAADRQVAASVAGAVAGSTETEAVSEPEPEQGPEPDLSLLSDEERVERMLEANGGRMRQAMIVDETGWSDAKVSQLLSAMAEAGRVEKLRLGRENLISLPDFDANDE
ncbi:helix-turn-helix transcriptional regulator [Haloferacaceae archaeon DSL9]